MLINIILDNHIIIVLAVLIYVQILDVYRHYFKTNVKDLDLIDLYVKLKKRGGKWN